MKLVITDFDGQIHPIKPKYLSESINCINAKKSFIFYRNLIKKYYPHTIPDKWINLMNKIIKKYSNITVTFIDYNRDCLLLQSALDDSHSYTNKKCNYIFSGGFYLEFNNKDIIVIESNNPDIPKSAILLKKNKIKITTLLDKFRKYSQGSNDTIKDFNTLNIFIAKHTSRNVDLTFSYKGKVYNKTVIYEYAVKTNIPFYEKKKNKIIINPEATNCSEEMINDIIKENVDTLEFNLVQYPSNFMMMMYLMEKLNYSNEKIQFCNYYLANENGSHKKLKLYIESKGKKSDIKNIVINVGTGSLSASEHFVLALQSLSKLYSVITQGTQTSGANGDITSIPMLYDIYCNVNFNYVTYPDNTPMQRIGVKIDLINKNKH